MFSSQLKYFLYGVLASASLISLSVSAGTADGVFGEYFKNIINTTCTTNQVVTGFSSIQNATYGKTNCLSLKTLLGDIFGTSSAPDGQAMIGFNPDGTPKYGDVNWRNSGGNITYTGGNIGIGTYTPTAKIEVAGLIRSTNNGSAYLQGGDDVTLNDVNIVNTLGVIGIQDNTKGRLQLGSNVSSYIAGSAGNIGIGTDTPTAKLDVVGKIVASDGVSSLSWKNYGVGHTIIDASAGRSPTGSAINSNNAAVAWTPSYPTLMGWNGGSTYGVRVDSARVADTVNSVPWASVTNKPTLQNCAWEGHDGLPHINDSIRYRYQCTAGKIIAGFGSSEEGATWEYHEILCCDFN